MKVTSGNSTHFHPKYRADIDGLRAIAILAVVIFHAFPKKLAGGFVGVDIFFVISGFLISTIIMKGLAGGRFSYWRMSMRSLESMLPRGLDLLQILCCSGSLTILITRAKPNRCSIFGV
jgi:hypothetical protein